MVISKFFGLKACFSTALALSFLLFGLPANGQVGLSGGYLNFKASDWLDAAGERTNKSIASLAGWQVGADYWFRLQQKRVEFTVEANDSSYSESGLPSGNQLEIAAYGLQLNTALYPLDFGSDCNCPTWSKSGDVFAKGFFIQLIAGGVYQDKKLVSADFSSEQQDLALKLGAGIGLDIGISDFFTVTPLVRYEYFPKLTWEGLATDTVGKDETTGNQIFAGIRLGFRFDELYKYSIRSY